MDISGIYHILGRDVHAKIYENVDIGNLLVLLSINRYHNNIIRETESYILFNRLKTKLRNSVSYQAINRVEIRKAYFIYKAIKHNYANIYRTFIDKLDHRELYFTFLLYAGITVGNITYCIDDTSLERGRTMCITKQMRYEIMVTAEYALMNSLSTKQLFIDIVHGHIPWDLRILSIERKINSLH